MWVPDPLDTVMAERVDVSVEIRKLRKKLRQIESLELLDRELTDEEEIKVLLRIFIDHRLRVKSFESLNDKKLMKAAALFVYTLHFC